MYSLREIKSKIFLTEAKEYIYDGMCISEPIMTMKNNHIIDNYFVYACDETQTSFTRPLLCFGILSEKNELDYVTQETNITEETITLKSKKDIEIVNKGYEHYSEIYPKVREFVFQDCNEEQKQLLKDYLDNLFTISGEVLWDYYNRLFPSFFEWANNVIEQGV